LGQYWSFGGLVRHRTLQERLIVSLDRATSREALKMVERLGRSVGMFRVGRRLYLSGGPDLVRDIRRRGAEVFLDLKFHDTPRALCKAAVEATRLGARIFDLHSSGSFEAMQHVRAEVARICRNEGLRRPIVLEVAMLTGLRPGEPIVPDGDEVVARLAKLAADAALDGVLTLPQAVPRIRALCGRRFIIVAPGLSLRSADSAAVQAIGVGDAVRFGADYLVVGSPIWNATDPLRAVREIMEEMERGMRGRPRGALELLTPRPA